MSSVSYIVKCVVCGREKQYGRKLLFFRFPQDIDRCRSWVKAIGIRELLFMPIDKLREQVVCGDHFDPICINEKLKRLHKVAIPSQSLNPPLCDALLSDFPKTINNPDTAPIMHNLRDFDYAPAKRRYKSAPRILNEDPVIDFERPLMNSLETLEHNERHAVRKPAGILNSIAVPLMTYSSSLEKGTVFAAEDPGSRFKLPFVPFIEEANHNEYNHKVYRAPKNTKTSSNVVDADLDYPNTSDVFLESNNEIMDHQNKATKKCINVKAMAHSRHTNACNGSLVPNSGNVVDADSYDPNYSDVSLEPKNDGIIDHQNKVTKKYINVKDMAHSRHKNAADTTFKKPLIGTVKPNLKTSVYKIPKISTQRNCHVSFGLQTLIKGSPRKANDSIVSSVLNVPKPNTETSGSRYKGIKQYTNNKLTIHSIQKNQSLVPVIRTEQRTTDAKTGTTTVRASKGAINNESTNKTTLIPSRIFRTSNGNILQVYKPADTAHANFDVSLVPNTKPMPSREPTRHTASPINTQTCDSPATISSNASIESPGASTDLLFVPYTQYAATVTPESTDAHTGEGTLDYGLPLMNCIGTVFQGNIHSTVKTEDIDASDETAIDIPLMQCFKTLENSSIL